MICLFVEFRSDGVVAESDQLADMLAGIDGLASSLVHTPSTTLDPYLNDGAPPALALQLYFTDIAAMEAALAPKGPLQALADGTLLPSLAGAAVTQQAMLVRTFPVPDPVFRAEVGTPHCTYLVTYEGAAEDLNLWLSYYIDHHPTIMARFPGIREIEIYTRIDWCSFLPFKRVHHMQRNKVVFDSPTALTEALNSPVRHAMREDFHKFPAYAGPNTHFPMLTQLILGR